METPIVIKAFAVSPKKGLLHSYSYPQLVLSTFSGIVTAWPSFCHLTKSGSFTRNAKLLWAHPKCFSNIPQSSYQQYRLSESSKSSKLAETCLATNLVHQNSFSIRSSSKKSCLETTHDLPASCGNSENEEESTLASRVIQCERAVANILRRKKLSVADTSTIWEDMQLSSPDSASTSTSSKEVKLNIEKDSSNEPTTESEATSWGKELETFILEENMNLARALETVSDEGPQNRSTESSFISTTGTQAETLMLKDCLPSQNQFLQKAPIMRIDTWQKDKTTSQIHNGKKRKKDFQINRQRLFTTMSSKRTSINFLERSQRWTFSLSSQATTSNTETRGDDQLTSSSVDAGEKIGVELKFRHFQPSLLDKTSSIGDPELGCDQLPIQVSAKKNRTVFSQPEKTSNSKKPNEKRQVKFLEKDAFEVMYANLMLRKRQKNRLSCVTVSNKFKGDTSFSSSSLSDSQMPDLSGHKPKSYSTSAKPMLQSFQNFKIYKKRSFSSSPIKSPIIEMTNLHDQTVEGMASQPTVQCKSSIVSPWKRRELEYLLNPSLVKPPVGLQRFLERQQFNEAVIEAHKRLKRMKESGAARVNLESISLLLPFYKESIVSLAYGIAKSTDAQLAKRLNDLSSRCSHLEPKISPVLPGPGGLLEVEDVFTELQFLQKINDLKLAKETTYGQKIDIQGKYKIEERCETYHDENLDDVTLPSQLKKPADIPYQQRDRLVKGGNKSHAEELVGQGIMLHREHITVRGLADHLQSDENDVMSLAEILLENLPTPETPLTVDEAELIAAELGLEKHLKLSPSSGGPMEREQKWVRRSPVVVVVGHVNHGKTTLLDTLQKTSIAASEAGRITQSVVAFEVLTKHTNTLLTFIDTPGHETFHAMRKRGVSIADVAVLVVAADEGIKPQTIEAYNTARSLRVPLIFAITKIDKANADMNRLENELRSFFMVEEPLEKIVCISAKANENVDGLEEAIASVTNQLDLKANLTTPRASAFVLETRCRVGGYNGMFYSCIVREGQLKVGGMVFIGSRGGYIKQIFKVKDGRMMCCAEAPEPGKPIELCVKLTHSPKTCFKVKASSNGAGELLIQLPTQKEWKQLQRFYESKAAAINQSSATSDKNISAGVLHAREYLQKWQEKVKEKEHIKSADYKKALSMKIQLRVNSIGQAVLESGLPTFQRFLHLSSPHPQLNLVLSAKDEGSMEAILDWIHKFNQDKTRYYEENVFSKLPDETRMKGLAVWQRNSKLDFLHVPEPLRIVSTSLGPLSEAEIQRTKELEAVVLSFALDQWSETQFFTKYPEVKFRSCDVIYNVFKDIEVSEEGLRSISVFQ